MDRFDVVVVGGRCAGSPLATHLARAGLSVAVLDRAEFPRDTLSTHIMESGTFAALRRLGVGDAIQATGVPLVRHTSAVLGGVDLSHTLDGEIFCLRRTMLDPILLDAARRAGADVRTGSRAVGLHRADGRVQGVVAVRRNGARTELRAPLVVGADGRTSMVARAAGARRYHLAANERASFFGYFRGWRAEGPPRVHFHRDGEDVALAVPTDGDLLLVIAAPPLHRLAEFRAGSDAAFRCYLRGFPSIDALLVGAERVGHLRALHRFPGYFREAAGPGWALAGDAGHFKDPVSGQGIADALTQAESLAVAVRAGLGGGDLDGELALWWRDRDRAAAPMYWFAVDLQRCGDIPPIVVEMMRQLARTPAGRQRFWDCFLQRRTPPEVFTPLRLARAVGSLVGPSRGAALGQAREMMREEMIRRRLARSPVFEAA